MIDNADSYITFLNEELAKRTQANSRFSMRAFARQLKLAPGEFSEILRGKRPLTLKTALKIARGLNLSPAEAQKLIYLAQYEKSRSLGHEDVLKETSTPRRQDESTQLTADMFHVVSDWYCFAILNLADTRHFRWNTSWIAKRLGISRPEVSVALSRLERVGLIERSLSGQYKIIKDFVFSPCGIPSEAIRHYHRQILSKADQALDFQGIDERDITGAGFAMDPHDLPALKKELSVFLRTLSGKYSRAKRKTEVYQLELALFRLTMEANNEK